MSNPFLDGTYQKEVQGLCDEAYEKHAITVETSLRCGFCGNTNLEMHKSGLMCRPCSNLVVPVTRQQGGVGV